MSLNQVHVKKFRDFIFGGWKIEPIFSKISCILFGIHIIARLNQIGHKSDVNRFHKHFDYKKRAWKIFKPERVKSENEVYSCIMGVCRSEKEQK